MRGAEAQHDLLATADDLGGDVHEGLAEALPLPAHDLGGEGQQGDPLAEVPGEPGDLEPRAVAVELGDRHPPGGEAGSELLDHVPLVAALVGQVDRVLGRDGSGQAGHDVAVAVLVEEQALTLAVLDELPADDEAVGFAVRVDLHDLGYPLLDQLLLGEVACASSLASTVALLAARDMRRPLAPLGPFAMGPRPERLPRRFGDGLDQLGTVRELPADEREVSTGAIARGPYVAAVEVAVAAHEHLAAALAHARQDLVEHPSGAVGRPHAAGPVAD